MLDVRIIYIFTNAASLVLGLEASENVDPARLAIEHRV